MTSYPAGVHASRPGAHPPDLNEVAHFLGAAVNVAMSKFAHDHQALAQRLQWPLEMVSKNPAHAREMVRLDLARHAVVQHLTGQLAPRPAPPPAARKPPTMLDRLKTAAQQEFDREVFAATHPVEALANHIHDQRLTHGGERHLARANDLIGGGVAGAGADLVEGVGKAADIYRRYVQDGVVTDAIGERFFGLPAPPSAADEAAKIVAPLRHEANLRPPRTFAGRLVASTPRMVALVMAPGIVGPAILGTQSLGAASNRAREAQAPDTPFNDAGIAATAGIDTLVGLLLKGRTGLDPATVIERLPEAVRSDALDVVARVATKSIAGAMVSGAQTGADNIVASATFDPNRPWGQGVGESLVFGATTGPFGGRNRGTPSSRPRLPAPPTPPQRPGSFAIQLGGAHRDVRGLQGYEAHHMPSNAVSPLPLSIGPAIALQKADHLRTASNGRWRAADEYRRQQKALIDAGDFAAAQDMDVQDIRSKFGDKYDPAIDQLIAHSRAKGHRQ